MKTIVTLALAIIVITLFSHEAEAAITITNFSLTGNSLSYDISGTLPDTSPANEAKSIFFVNPNVSANLNFT